MKFCKIKNIIVFFVLLALILLQADLSAQETEKVAKKKFSITNLFKKTADNEQTKKENIVAIKDRVPKISVDKLFFDYGEIVQSEYAVAKFEIHNLGNADLLIFDIETSCNCMEMSLSSNTIKPKSKEILTIQYNTNIVGDIRKSITIVSNDNYKDRLTLLLTGKIIVKK